MPLPELDSRFMEISGENPAGRPLDYAVKSRLDEDRKEVDPSLYDDNDPLRPTEPKYADWEDIVELACDVLTNQTKDLNLVIRLFEAITRSEGFPGLLQGMELLVGYVSTCWEYTYPAVESEEDIDLRAGPFLWVADAERGARFPTTFRMLPMIITNNNKYRVLDWANSKQPNAPISFDMITKGMAEMDYELAQKNFECLRDSLQLLAQLQEILDEYMANFSPSLIGLRNAMLECMKIAEGIANKLRPVESDQPAEDQETESDGGTPRKTGGGLSGWNPQNAQAARSAIYSQLRDAADLLIQLEPHSPIPYLIRKAIDLGELPYPQLMTRLIDDSGTLMSLRKELGLPEED